MTYEDPRSGRERNLGQDDVGSSMGSWISGIIFVAAIAFGAWYFFNHSQKVADVNQPAPSTAANSSSTSSPAEQSSGPGVQGSAGSTNGPAAQPDNGSSTGASTGTSGTTSQPANDGASGNTSQPAQDSTGVKGAEGSKNGPAPTAPNQQ
jgi:hypothetical protein